MGQLSTHLAELLLSFTRIAQASGVDRRLQNAYLTLCAYLQQRYALNPALLQNSPDTIPIQQLALGLSEIPAETTPELLARLQAVITSLESYQSPEVVGVLLEDVRSQFLKINDVMASGSGVRIVHSKVNKDAEIAHIVSTNATITDTTQLSTGSAVKLQDVKVGGDLKIGPIFQTVKQFIQGTPADVHALRQRMNILSLVENIWINGILRPLQEGETQLHLRFQATPELVDNQPFAKFVQTPVSSDSPFEEYEEIINIFQQFRQQLLLVGEPGSGKTILLLQIAQASIAAARQELTQPIPIIFHLASWSPAYASLQSWILAEMKEKYRVPNKTVEPWLADDELLLVLDGLDEVKEDDRQGCLLAINKFLDDHAIGIVVGCRKREYIALNERLHLPMAVEIQPLTPEQVTAHLEAKQLAESAIATLILTNEKISELSRSPLGLHILTVAAQQEPSTTWTAEMTGKQWQDQLFATYLSVMFRRRSGRHPYPPGQTVAWLRWLARQMAAQGQSIFLLEQMQPTLLATGRQRLFYQFGLRAVSSLLFLVSCPLVVGIIFFMKGVSFEILLKALMLGSLLGGVIAAALLLTSVLAYWLHDLLAVVVTLGVLAALVMVGFGAISPALAHDDPLVSVAMIIVLFLGPLGSLPGLFLSGKRPIRPINDISWSWHGIRDALLMGVIGSAGLGLVLGLLLDMGNGIGIGFLVGLCCILPVSLFSMSKREKIQPAIYPNQGIRNALYTALIVFVAIAFVAILIAVLWHLSTTDESKRNLVDALIVGMILGVSIGISTALAAGGATSLQHYLLRAILARSGLAPWRMKYFLDYATDRVFLSRIGGGYIFYHRLLMEYLVNTKETPDGSKQTTPVCSTAQEE